MGTLLIYLIAVDGLLEIQLCLHSIERAHLLPLVRQLLTRNFRIDYGKTVVSIQLAFLFLLLQEWICIGHLTDLHCRFVDARRYVGEETFHFVQFQVVLVDPLGVSVVVQSSSIDMLGPHLLQDCPVERYFSVLYGRLLRILLLGRGEPDL